MDSKRIAKATTADGKFITLWSDGCVTFALGQFIRGVGVSKSQFECDLDVSAGWLVMGDACLYESSEIGRLVKSARRAVRQNYDRPLTAMRRMFRGDKIRPMKAGATFKWISA